MKRLVDAFPEMVRVNPENVLESIVHSIEPLVVPLF